jgi:hypothetical protein
MMTHDENLQISYGGATSTVGLYEELIRAKQAAIRLYTSYPNVVGISAGTKYVKFKATDNHASIHFYVLQKLSPKTFKGKILPRFVYGRYKNGKINRSLKFATDVIEVGRIRMACGGGSRISGSFGLTRHNGTITFIFKNKAICDNYNYYVVSCAHVIGNIDGQQDMPVIVNSECSPGTKPFATTIFSSTQHNWLVEYDIALAQINPECLPLPDLKIVGTNISIRSFMKKDQILPPLPVNCMLPVSNARSGTVHSYGGSICVDYERGTYKVHNAWMVELDRSVQEGDSGGLLYSADTAVGIIFASSSKGLAWFHPLIDAFDYISQKTKKELICLSS